ncbi:MAG TPA: M10 family metallopeptidase C-terminal domain-containing protein, partial [Allosphingosinicella sp.]|nr:M10 family metallopeptidase C-terminal domain-containing protein [Allosphingosinicella sp.]
MTKTGTAGNDAISGGSGDDTLSGLAGDDVIKGFAGIDRLDGGTGNDQLYGGAGDDIYFVDSAGDLLFESSGNGNDAVFSSVSFALAASLEQLTLTGSTAISGTGNGLANAITGNSAANVLDGGAGADVLKGLGGSDTYVVDNAGDQVIEAAGGGTDTVLSSVTHGLAANVERLTLTGSAAIDATGNTLANRLIGNSAANVLDGGAGADDMRGGGGNDTYVVDVATDRITEASGAGTDTVRSSVSLTLGANVENLTLTGSAALNGTGNALNNTIVGNAAANLLNGGAGGDLLTGGGGADTFAFTSALGGGYVDRITDFATGVDKILLGGASGQPFAALASGTLGAEAFRVGSARDASDRILYNANNGGLYYDADGSGSGAAVQIASLTAGLSLKASNFIVSGAPNNLPTISSGATATTAEGTSTSTIVYQTAAQDADGDRIVYGLAGTDAARFTIDQAGAMRFVASPDFETKSSYSFTVTAFDSSGAGSSKAVTLSVTDMAEGIRVVQETAAANDSSASAQPLSRSLFSVAADPTLNDDSLPSLRIEGAIQPGTDKDFFSVTLKAGELLVLDVDGTTTLDSLVRVFGPGGAELVSNDDLVSFDTGSSAHAGVTHNQDSFVRFRAPQDGTYTFSIQAFSNVDQAATTGEYTLNVSIGPPASRAEIDAENVQALLSGEQWGTTALTYGFTSSGADYGPGEGVDEVAAGMSQLNLQQQQAVRTILGQMAGITNLSFTEAASAGSAQLRYALSDFPETAHGYYPGSGDGGDSWYNTKEYVGPIVGNYEWTTFIHETGHTLGLKHGHEAPALSPDRDSVEFSVMTYRSYVGASVDEGSGYTNETWGFPQTLMMYDIAALQEMYGADYTYNSGNSVYTWSPVNGSFRINGAVQWTPGGNRVFMTLWDGGGEDTYDLSTYGTNTTIDLRPGEWTTTSTVQLANLGQFHFARGNIANALLFNGDTRSLIENAIGGSGNDTVIANQAANRLTGGGGGDLLNGGLGNDTLDGGSGLDVVRFTGSKGAVVNLGL